MKKMLIFIFLSISILNASSLSQGMKYFIKGQYHKALPHFVKASNNGNKQAQFYLANMYEKGLGVKKDKRMASKLYTLYSTNTKKKSIIKNVKTKKKISRRIVKKEIINKKFSKRLKKYYNPELQGAKEVVFE